MKGDLYSLELKGNDRATGLAMIQKWEADRKKMQDAFRAEAKEQLAALDRFSQSACAENAALELAKSQASLKWPQVVFCKYQ